jgi:hypothetical protein
MSIVTILLAMLFVFCVLAVAWFIKRRQRRADFFPARTQTLPVSQGSQSLARWLETSTSQSMSPPTLALGVWRPPPRQQLLRRQEILRLNKTEEARERPTELGGRHTLGEIKRQASFISRLAEGSRDKQGEPAEAKVAGPIPVDEPRVSRVGRKRQGLESLITEIPSTNGEHRHASNNH